MEYQATPLALAISDVLDQPTPARPLMNLTIKAAGFDVPYIKVMRRQRECDYVKNYADEDQVVVRMMAGKYATRIYPNRDELQIIISHYDSSATSRIPQGVVTYEAVLNDTGPAIIELNSDEAVDEHSLDMQRFVDVTFQIWPASLTMVRSAHYGQSIRGPGKSVTPAQAIKSVLSWALSGASIPAAQRLQGVDMDPADSGRTLSQIALSDALPLIELPKYIQKNYGVYPYGLGSYIWANHWYIYPLSDVSRVSRVTMGVTFVLVPPKKLPQLENTYLIVGNSATVLITAKPHFADDSGLQTARYGSGVSFNDPLSAYAATQLRQGKATTKANQTTAIITPKTGVADVTHFVPERFTTNADQALTLAGQRDGGVVRLTWENSYPDLLQPGHPVTIVYVEQVTGNARMVRIPGILLHATHASHAMGDISDRSMVTQSQLLIYVASVPSTSRAHQPV